MTYDMSDDIEQWCGTTLQELSHAALDRQRWAAIVTMVSDTNGHWAHVCRWWWWWHFRRPKAVTASTIYCVSKYSQTRRTTAQMRYIIIAAWICVLNLCASLSSECCRFFKLTQRLISLYENLTVSFPTAGVSNTRRLLVICLSVYYA